MFLVSGMALECTESNEIEYGLGLPGGQVGNQGVVTTYPPFKRKAIRAAQVSPGSIQRTRAFCTKIN